jgi:hypothetical protein
VNALKCGLVAAVWVAAVSGASADPTYTYSFNEFRNHNTPNSTTGETQLFVDVSGYGAGQVLFTFRNIGPNDSSICDMYFDDGALLRLASVIDGDQGSGGMAGVYFTQDSTREPTHPANLPGGDALSPKFETSYYQSKKEDFSADSDEPVQPYGVNPDEWLGIVFDLDPGTGLDSVIADLLSGELRVGIHVQGFADGGSESFINNPVPIPAPAAMLLGALGLGLLGGLKRRAA